MHAAGTLRIPRRAVGAHALHPHRTARQLRQVRSIHGGVPRIVAAVGAGPHHPDAPDFLRRQSEQLCDAVARGMRLLRTRPDGRLAAPHIRHGACRSHAGVRLKRPMVFGLDDSRSRFECRLRVAIAGGDFTFDHGRAADMVVQAISAGGRLRLRGESISRRARAQPRWRPTRAPRPPQETRPRARRGRS